MFVKLLHSIARTHVLLSPLARPPPYTHPLPLPLHRFLYSTHHSSPQNARISLAVFAPTHCSNTPFPLSVVASSTTSFSEPQRSLSTFTVCASRGREGALVVTCGRSASDERADGTDVADSVGREDEGVV